MEQARLIETNRSGQLSATLGSCATRKYAALGLPLYDILIPKLHYIRDHSYHFTLVPAVLFTRSVLLQRRSIGLDLLPTTVPSDTFTYSKCPEDMIQELVGSPVQSHDDTNGNGQTTIFSPEGRLYQVEYALEAISHAGTALGILATDGVVLAAERKVTSKLLEQDTSAEKLYILNEYAQINTGRAQS